MAIDGYIVTLDNGPRPIEEYKWQIKDQLTQGAIGPICSDSKQGKQIEEIADRNNQGKLEWSLPDYKSLEPLIRVMMWGKENYSRDNWKKGFIKEELLDSLMRHVLALQSGKEIDDGPGGTGESHVGGVLFNAMCYEYCRINNMFK